MQFFKLLYSYGTGILHFTTRLDSLNSPMRGWRSVQGDMYYLSP